MHQNYSMIAANEMRAGLAEILSIAARRGSGRYHVA